MKKQYNHFTNEERERLYSLLNSEISKQEISKLLNKNRASIYREVSRNFSRIGYLPDKAQKYYLSRRGKQSNLTSDLNLQKEVVKLLKKKYSPRQIYLELKKKYQKSPVSSESIYQFIYSKEGKKLELNKFLRRKHKKRKTRKPNTHKRISIPNRVSIHTRPAAINARETFGHWEGDLMIFSQQTDNLITLRERKSRVILAIKNKNKESDPTIKNIIKKAKSSGQEIFLSITFDNGGEFARHELITINIGSDIYFCDPYASYQKGSNEQGNGIIRAELPRSTELWKMSQLNINSMMKDINNRPMELHQGESASDIFKKLTGDMIGGFVALQV